MISNADSLPYDIFERTKKKHKSQNSCVSIILEAPPGFEPGVKDLQSHALPLGYGAIVRRRSLRCSFRRRAAPSGEKFRCAPASLLPNPKLTF